MRFPEVTQVQYLGDRDYEISIEVSEHVLRQYGLTMSEISQAVRNTSVDLPGGTIKTEGGDILLRTEGQVYTGMDYGDLVLRTFPDGTRLTLANIADIRDGFVETDGFGHFDGEPTATLRVLATGQQNELHTADVVRKYVAEKSANLPEGVSIDIWIDRSHYLRGRLEMMTKNMLQGALLVFIVLSLFLRMKIAGWVVVGIPVAFLGTLALMPLGPWPVTINMLSLFGFIIVLGIVVDDAIIIGESIYTEIRAEGHTLDNVIHGAHRVAAFFEAISMVVILCLFFSLVESKLILPAHLARARISPIDEDDLFRPQRKISRLESIPRFFTKLQRHVQHGLHRLIENHYRPLLAKAIEARGLTVTIFFALLIICVGLLYSSLVRVVLFPLSARFDPLVQ